MFKKIKSYNFSPSFNFYAASVGINVLGRSLFEIAAIIYVYQKSGQNSMSIALYMIAMAVPTIVLPPIGGALGSRYSRKRIIIFTNIITGLISLCMFFSPESSYIYVLAMLISSITVLTGPSRGSFIPDLVQKENLLKANSLIQSTSSLANIMGVLLAGGLVLISNPVYGFILHSSCFIMSSFLMVFTKPKISEHELKNSKKIKELAPLLKQMIKSIGELYKLKPAFKISLLLGVVLGISGVINVLYLVFLTKVLNTTESLYSALMLTESAGLFLGSFIVDFFQKRIGIWKLLFTAVIIDGFCIASHLLINNTIIFFFIGLITGMVGAIIFIVSSTLLQKAIEEHRRARIMGAHQTVIGLFSIPGLLTGGIIQNFGNTRQIFFISGLLIMCVGLTYFINEGKRIKRSQFEKEGVKYETK